MHGPLYQSCHCSQWGLWSVGRVAVSPGCLPALVSRLWGSVLFWCRGGGEAVRGSVPHFSTVPARVVEAAFPEPMGWLTSVWSSW